ncbi:hypothetical protein EIP91_003386 [Steccherinum ochraceum]|uniref:HMG box domain-containing protein n=1 Tax=Steccherinum ochraceum TaxID=92696 RepID=A0A4R0RE33_9APHY|nr:hypothetical protein EIP91_003386 [Steccherinum ochraceum]
MASLFARRALSRTTVTALLNMSAKPVSLSSVPTRPAWSRTFLTTTPRLDPAAAAAKVKAKPAKSATPKSKVAKEKAKKHSSLLHEKPVKLTKELLPPKRPRSAFIAFSAHRRHEGGISTGKPKEDMLSDAREAGKAWKELTEEQKQPYVTQFEMDMAQYRAARAAWWDNASPEVIKAVRQRKASKVKRLAEDTSGKWHPRRLYQLRDVRKDGRQKPSAYRLWVSEWLRSEGRQRYPGNMKEAFRVAGPIWKSMSEEQRQSYQDTCDKIRAEMK